MKLSRSTRWRLALGDLKAQPWRTLLAVLVLTPLAASWFLLAAVSRSLAGLGTVGEERNIVVTEPDVFDVANVHLGAEHLDATLQRHARVHGAVTQQLERFDG